MRSDATTSIAKLTRPRQFNVLARERLFDRLERGCERARTIAVVGPPGAGKTTLVATWLEATGRPCLWMQVDSGDEDLATFFYYLGKAALPSKKRGQRSLPLLTPEYLGDVPSFSRRFFRQMFSQLPKDAVLVLDNYQETPVDHVLHSCIAQAIEEVPQGANVMILSRHDLPPAFARMVANEHVAFVDWTDLRVTVEEARQIGNQRSVHTVAEIDHAHSRSGGWMAGLTLMLEHAGHTGTPGSITSDVPPQRIFDYFATQLFAETTEINRTILRKLSLPPRMSARLAVELTGNASAGRLLDQLYRRHLFTDRRGGEQGIYSFHALFRAFLLHEVEVALGPGEVAQLQKEAARLLESEHMTEEAMSLYVAGRDWGSAARLFVAEASLLLATGRWKTVMDWFQKLPTSVVDASHWVLHWAGAAHVAVAPAQAREMLGRAHAVAVDAADATCQIQCAAAIIESCCIEWSRFSLMDPWIPVLERVIDDALAWPSIDAQLRAMNALLSALAYRAPEHPLLPSCVERTIFLLSKATDPNIKVVAASTITNHGGHSAQPRVVRSGLALLDQWIDDSAVTAPNRGAGLFSQVWGRHCLRDLEGARRSLTALERLAGESGLTYISTFSAFMGTNVEGCHGDVGIARQWFHKLLARADGGRWYDRAITCCAAIWLGLFEHDPQYAMTYGEEGIALIADGVANSAIQWRFPVAVAHAYRGDIDAVRYLVGQIETFMEKHHLQYWGALCRATDAILSLQLGDEDGAVRAIVEMLRLHRYTEETYLWYLRADLPALMATALAHRLDPDQVRQMIRAYHVPAPRFLTVDWPWSIRVRALGTFTIEVDDAPLTFKGKVPRKPLALLKAVIAFGGRDIPITRLADALWPDLDGDDALRAFHTALFRLRALLIHDVVSLVDGRITLDRHRVWVDALVFDALCIEARSGNAQAAHRALALHAGVLFEGEPEEPWVLEARDRCERNQTQLRLHFPTQLSVNDP